MTSEEQPNMIISPANMFQLESNYTTPPHTPAPQVAPSAPKKASKPPSEDSEDSLSQNSFFGGFEAWYGGDPDETEVRTSDTDWNNFWNRFFGGSDSPDIFESKSDDESVHTPLDTPVSNKDASPNSPASNENTSPNSPASNKDASSDTPVLTNGALSATSKKSSEKSDASKTKPSKKSSKKTKDILDAETSIIDSLTAENASDQNISFEDFNTDNILSDARQPDDDEYFSALLTDE